MTDQQYNSLVDTFAEVIIDCFTEYELIGPAQKTGKFPDYIVLDDDGEINEILTFNAFVDKVSGTDALQAILRSEHTDFKTVMKWWEDNGYMNQLAVIDNVMEYNDFIMMEESEFKSAYSDAIVRLMDDLLWRE